jgi:hypothetical protein
LLARASTLDRSGRKLGALLLAALPFIEVAERVELVGLYVDEAVIAGRTAAARLQESAINQLDLRGSDVAPIEWDQVTLAGLIVDGATRVGASFPDAGFLVTEYNGREHLLSGELASQRLDHLGRRPPDTAEEGLTAADRAHPLYVLLGRIARVMLRHHWIREGGDDRSSGLLEEREWPRLRALLLAHELLTEDDQRPAGGPPTTFYHVRKATSILREDDDEPDVAAFLTALQAEIRKNQESPPEPVAKRHRHEKRGR